jgi:hypothetical protein
MQLAVDIANGCGHGLYYLLRSETRMCYKVDWPQTAWTSLSTCLFHMGASDFMHMSGHHKFCKNPGGANNHSITVDGGNLAPPLEPWLTALNCWTSQVVIVVLGVIVAFVFLVSTLKTVRSGPPRKYVNT